MGFLEDINNLQETDGSARTGQMFGQMAHDGRKAHYLMQAGRVGIATVSGMRETGIFVNNNPECELDLQVVVDGGTPYAVSHRQVLATVALPGFQPGASVPVRVDPDNPQSLIIA